LCKGPSLYNSTMDEKPDSKRRPIGMIVTIIVVLSLVFYLVAKFAG